MNSGYPTHTATLATLFAALNEANAALRKVANKPGVTRSPQYNKAMDAYRAYWNAVDVDAGRPLRDA